jgi:hypothetical protein
METRSWKAIRAERALNEERVATYRRLTEAERLLEPVRALRGIESPLDAALEANDPDDTTTPPEDLYLSTLADYVAALGGHIEVRAVFAEQTIPLLRRPDPSAGGDDSQA